MEMDGCHENGGISYRLRAWCLLLALIVGCSTAEPGIEPPAADDDATDDDSGDDDTAAVEPAPTQDLDSDGDGWPRSLDCDDHDPAANHDDLDGDGHDT